MATETAQAPDYSGSLNAAGTHVWLHYPETGAVWECPVDVAAVFVGRGWEPTDPPAPQNPVVFDPLPAKHVPSDVVPPEAPVVQTGFDPDEHDVKSVNKHLAEHAESAPGEVARVLQLEADGQARKGILHGPHGSPESNGD